MTLKIESMSLNCNQSAIMDPSPLQDFAYIWAVQCLSNNDIENLVKVSRIVPNFLIHA